ncbi:GTP pyrophosphokinase [Pseudomonas sp. MDT1-17]
MGSRAKTLNSFLEKLNRKSYTDPFNQLDDLAGVRVVCLYNSDIPKVTEIIRTEFEIVQEIDKREELETNKFGYIGNHFIIRLGNNYSGARYDDLRTLRCEIQVRTVVQDAWSIIQHHMVYKKESQVPSNLIRKLNGLAGLFETVDDQFEFIRMQRDMYLDSVRESKNAPDNFLENELNYDSLVEFVQWRYNENLDEDDREIVSTILDTLNEIDISTLKDIELLLEQNQKFIDLAAEIYINICREENPEDDDFIWGPIKIAVAISATLEWRSKFPWGRNWSNAFIQADSQL